MDDVPKYRRFIGYALLALLSAVLAVPFIVTKTDPAEFALWMIVGLSIFGAIRREFAHGSEAQ